MSTSTKKPTRPRAGRPAFPPHLRKKMVTTKLTPRVIAGFHARARANGTSFAREIESAYEGTT